MNKKILIFSTAYYPFVGGAEVAVREITNILGSDFEFELITARFRKDLPEHEMIGNILVHRIGFGYPLLDKLTLPFSGAFKAYRLSRKEDFLCFWGIMATFGSGAGYICNIFRKIKRLKKIPIVLTLQEGDSEDHFKFRWAGLINLSWWLALKNTDFLTGLSDFLLTRATRMGYKGPYALVPNGVNIKLFSQTFSTDEVEKIKEKLGKKQNEIFLVTTSRLTRKNAVDDIISALTCIPKNISLVVIGEGPEGLKLQKQAVDLKVVDRVKFLGFVPQNDIPKYFSACDIFIRPSRSEGFGNSFIEAMASRLPVIATPVGGIVDFIDDKETGFFCSPDNPKSIAETISFVVRNPDLTEHIIKKAYDRVVSKYGWDCVADQMKNNVFDKI